MEYISELGTGESLVRVSRSERIRLQNESINPETTKLFLLAHQLPVTVEFSTRVTKNRWGTAWPKQKRIVLYRHSVWMFIHELAHVLAGPDHQHDYEFANAVEVLYTRWRALEGGTT